MRPTFFRPSGPLSTPLIRDFLLLVSVEVPEDIVNEWTRNELLLAYDWATREHLHASDNSTVRRRPKPWFISCAENILTIRRFGGTAPVASHGS